MPNTETADDLRQALRRLAKAVCVISLQEAEERQALVVTAVSEVSLDPPSMAVCINRRASIFPAMAQHRPFCLNILSARQQPLAQRCVEEAQGELRFEIGAWSAAASGAPYLQDAQANMFCETVGSISHGSHDLFLAEVTAARVVGEVDPLIYADAAYGRFARLTT